MPAAGAAYSTCARPAPAPALSCQPHFVGPPRRESGGRRRQAGRPAGRARLRSRRALQPPPPPPPPQPGMCRLPRCRSCHGSGRRRGGRPGAARYLRGWSLEVGGRERASRRTQRGLPPQSPPPATLGDSRWLVAPAAYGDPREAPLPAACLPWTRGQPFSCPPEPPPCPLPIS